MIIVLLGPQPGYGWFAEYGVRIVFAWPAIVLALLFVTFPLTVRAVQPVLKEVDIGQRKLAHLWASQWQTFWRVLLPALSLAIISGVGCSPLRGRWENSGP